MLRTAIRKTPGVYVTELDAFPPSVVGVQTAVPAFIGYTQKAEIDGHSAFNQPVEINSMADFEAIFGGPAEAIFKLEHLEGSEEPKEYDLKVTNPDDGKATYWKLEQTASAKFRLYSNLRLFYNNGGATCYVVSVGDYSKDLTNEKDLENGLNAIKEQDEPTLLVVPDGAYLKTGYQSLVRQMLRQCSDLQDRVAILDVPGGDDTTNSVGDTIKNFRQAVGSESLDYGMAYFPFLETSLFDSADFTYWNVQEHKGNLATLLDWQNINLNNGGKAEDEEATDRYKSLKAEIQKMRKDKREDPEATKKRDQHLTAALPVLARVKTLMARRSSILPPSAAMAGVCTRVDSTRGVWNAPANLAFNSVRAPALRINSEQQEDLNVPVNGKAINVIREFTGRGTVVWGARTLDGNSLDWRYIQVRRTSIYVQQSLKAALDPYVFAPNDAGTWSTVVSMSSSFLHDLWARGGLMGGAAQEAFTVECGLGKTMTAQDVLDGYMIVQVTLQMPRPAEVIEITFKQQMQGFVS